MGASITEIIKPDAFRGGIQTNIDPRLDPKVVKEREQRERRIAFINEQYKKAEQDEINGTDTPDVIYSDLQRTDVFTADPAFDQSRAAISDMQSLPIKQYGVSSTGDFEVWLDENSAALEEVKNRKFCIECGDRQPEMPELWQLAADRLQSHIPGEPPADFKHGERCCYCGAALGLGGDALQRIGFEAITPDQLKILESMFGTAEQNFAKA